MIKPYNTLLAILLLLFCACQKPKPLFEDMPSSHTGIHFSNDITETDSINPLDVVNVYNGGGVGIGDFNNDGLPDIYFTGNMVANKLYLNRGDLKFDDVTKTANVDGMGHWGRGVAVIDINNDGWLDLYVCNSILANPKLRTNLLYINQGKSADGIPRFKEMGKEYGLNMSEQSAMASFFDYDNDGDLDMYLTVNNATATYNPSIFGKGFYQPDRKSGRLYRNDHDDKLNHPVFTDVTVEAGVTRDGYGHGASTVDINNDGWKDIYISNDFISSNILFINNHDGTFTDRSMEYFKHTAYNAMGQDVIDINNDGLPDVIELDMNPEDNFRKKMMLGANMYQTYQNFDNYTTQYQYVRNILQLNQGPRLENGKPGAPVFSEIGFLSGISQTDWSWTPLVADYNNDGYRDIIITNGFPKDVSDHDFMAYRQRAYSVASKKELLAQIPQIKLHNYAYVNNGDLTFKDVSKDWGFDVKNFSSGGVYADLDNDGDLDVVINNMNDEASVYRNTSRDDKEKLTDQHYLKISFVGDKFNLNGLGATAELYYDHGKTQVYENTPYRGYVSSLEGTAHFGLGKITRVDSVIIKWPGINKCQKLVNIKADTKLTVKQVDARQSFTWGYKQTTQPLFNEVTDSLGIKYANQDMDFIDFNIQKLLPHKFSEYSPALAVGDVDGNGIDDMVIGGSLYNPAQVLLQQANGKFIQRAFSKQAADIKSNYKDEGLLLFDADGDGDLDLYASSGGYHEGPESAAYQDRFYVNDGKGNFTLATSALPANTTSKLCVRACDYNQDGKPDLFVSGRVSPWNYPKPVSSFILRNDSQNGQVKFTDVTKEVAPALLNIGMVCDALFSDFNNDNKPDLILAGEFMPVTFLANKGGKFENVTAATGLENKTGWWNTIVAGDFRHTGRMDYIVGNGGTNTIYQASEQYPVSVIGKDFDKNGGFAVIPSIYFPDSNGVKREYPAVGRDDLLKQNISFKKRYTNYRSYATATMDELITPEQREGAIKLSANTMQSCYLRNEGNGKFTIIPLPQMAQISVLNGMVADDFDGDGNLDVAINGNDYGTEVSTGRYDALNGLLLKGDGKGNFKPLSILQSGIYLPGNGKALAKLQSSKGGYLVAATQHRGKLQVLQLNKPTRNISVKPDDMSAKISYRDGRSQKQEFYYGSSFLSQSGRFLTLGNNVSAVTVTNNKGQSRNIALK
ncbi:VCBS repeat-containing protein [Mucilaginibacter sp. JRF]|uniref:VCBS repeat-containing protein n=1 Tax=Mucilaginibacter sp. JRF TaxID=2780088 RepID=UPI00187EA644|nr:VCBS repeat-containing protein [Mucilaginibacter sp. JRF]MBE9585425.1 VCBS repeat-containing protein [Mucilaginibacter sp. JRF]